MPEIREGKAWRQFHDDCRRPSSAGHASVTRLTNGFSKKIENHEHSVAIHYMNYNFARIHQTLRVTPAVEAGISDHVWSLEEIVGLLP
jgi:hypothetical protein